MSGRMNLRGGDGAAGSHFDSGADDGWGETLRGGKGADFDDAGNDGWGAEEVNNGVKNLSVGDGNDWDGEKSGDARNAGGAGADKWGDAQGNGHGGAAPSDNACRNCGQEGHFSRECEAPRRAGGGGACFNCGEPGHNRADCTKPTKFTGACYNCGEEGHSRNECPQPQQPRKCRDCPEADHLATECPERICHACNEKGHMAGACTGIRLEVFKSATKGLDANEAWKAMMKTDPDDHEDFLPALLAYAKAGMGTGMAFTFPDIEEGLRNGKSPFYLIAKTYEDQPEKTLVGIDGKGNKEFILQISLSPDPRNESEQEAWPEDEASNLLRLANCGLEHKSHVMFCHLCKQAGHTKKFCPDAESYGVSDDKKPLKCIHCKEEGHSARKCPLPPSERTFHGACYRCKKRGHQADQCPSREGCRKCGEHGHMSRECPNQTAETCRKCGEEGHFARDCPTGGNHSSACHNCGETGHMSRECPNERVMKCRNCDEIGHQSRECPKPRDYSRVKCRNCGEMGHTIVRCKQPVVEQPDDGQGGGGGWGGGAAAVAQSGGGGSSGGGGGDWGASGAGDWGASGAGDSGAGATGGDDWAAGAATSGGGDDGW